MERILKNYSNVFSLYIGSEATIKLVLNPSNVILNVLLSF